MNPAPLQASVLFLRLRDLASQPAAEQSRRRDSLNAIARAAAGAWPADARLVLDAPDGLAIVGRGDPCRALDAARRAATAGADPALGIGLHHGSVHAEGPDASARLFAGEGLSTAASVAALATGGSVLASLAFREAVAARSAQEAQAFRPAGEFVDGHQQSHHLYAVDTGAARARAQRRGFIGTAAIVGILGAGVAVRLVRDEMEAARRPAVIRLDIRPSGDVYVDGELKGTAPPMSRLSIPAGDHAIEIRSGRFKPLHLQVQLNPGEEMELRHVFTSGGSGSRPAPRRPSLMERLKNLVQP